MWLGIKNVIMANHMISLITSSTTDPSLTTCSITDTSFVLGKSDGIDQRNTMYFDKVKND